MDSEPILDSPWPADLDPASVPFKTRSETVLRRSFGFAITAIGIVVVAVAALADQIGMGESDDFEWRRG